TKVNVIKDRAALYNLSIGAIARTANIAIKGIVATRFKEEGREIDVRVRLRKGGDFRLSRLRNILIHSPLDIEVPLSEVAYITQGVGPNEIKRLDQQRVVLVTANITDTPLNKVIMDITALIEKIEIEKANEVGDSRDTEKDIVMSLSGESQQMRESFDSLRFALILSILMVYMIMAAQFESLWQPFIIMFTVPLSLIGVLAILFLTRTPISVVVMLGVIILGGIVVNNGIILIDCINNLRKKGVELLEAVIESAKTRLRPIFMTTMTTVLGLLPLALGISEGSELQSPMAITVMGGLMISTILTLFVIPCVYIIVAALIERSPVLKIAPVLKLQPALKPVIEKKVKAIPLPSPPEFKREIPGPKIKPSIIEKVPTQTDVGLPSPAAVAEPLIIETSLPGLNKRQKQLLEHLKKVKRITRKEYAVTFKISVPTAARDLKELLSKGMIIAKGPLGPGRWYELKS
ncbi:MAG: efflux RND transporter permease subunit, partial [Candidatus Omnitrophica bacterium]|nr:efflux RND transporter permease subunit [Candidatus Omnitrophota bacterium]